MSEHRVSRIVIADEGRSLQGVISLSDIADYEPDRTAASVLREVVSRESSAITR